MCRRDISGHEDEKLDDGTVEVNPDEDELGFGSGTGNGGNSSPNSTTNIPQHAWDILNYVRSHNGNPPPGYRGGTPYGNDGRNGTQVLPQDAPYYEYDIYPYTPGINRGKERIVIGGSGAAWYTWDHYFHFISMEESL